MVEIVGIVRRLVFDQEISRGADRLWTVWEPVASSNKLRKHVFTVFCLQEFNVTSCHVYPVKPIATCIHSASATWASDQPFDDGNSLARSDQKTLSLQSNTHPVHCSLKLRMGGRDLKAMGRLIASDCESTQALCTTAHANRLRGKQ